MNTRNNLSDESPSARIVTGEQCSESLAAHFGDDASEVEAWVQTGIGFLLPHRQIKDWELYELSNGGCYLAPCCGSRVIARLGNGVVREISPQSAGILATLGALKIIADEASRRSKRHAFRAHFELLYNYAEEDQSFLADCGLNH